MSSCKKKLLYGIDLDGICFGFGPAFSKWLEDKTGIPMPAWEEITSYYWHENVSDLSSDVFWSEFHSFGHAGGYRHLELLHGAKRGLERLVWNGHDIVYITNRPNYARPDTLGALREHRFPFMDNVVFAEGKKAPIINERGVDVFIDDSPRTIAEICEGTKARIYCMDYPFNRNISQKHIYSRVSSWGQFLEMEGVL